MISELLKHFWKMKFEKTFKKDLTNERQSVMI